MLQAKPSLFGCVENVSTENASTADEYEIFVYTINASVCLAATENATSGNESAL